MSKAGSKAGSVKSRSNASSSSRHTRSSSASIAAALARAEAQAAKAEALFSERESQLKVQQAQLEASMTVEKARLEASLDSLRLEKKAAATLAKAEALEAAAEQEYGDIFSKSEQLLVDQKERTKEYVQNHSIHTGSISMPPLEGPFEAGDQPAGSQPPYVSSVPIQHQTGEQGERYEECSPLRQEFQPLTGVPDLEGRSISSNMVQGPEEHILPCGRYKYVHSQSLPQTTPYAGQNPLSGTTCRQTKSEPQDCNTAREHVGPHPLTASESQPMSDFVRFIARRELVSTGLIQFRDCPENYRSWKASFRNALRDLNLSASEEMDLLVKWLGKESAEHAKRMRAVHIHHPQQGLKLIWDRLDECYGSPEVIESSLFKRLENVPRISNKDNRRLRELGDLLLELQAAKADGDLLGLAYLDTSRGISPVVQKLPFHLQERWLALGSKYKEEHNVSYPPFSYFVEFVCQQAKMRNDPSFSHLMVQDEPLGQVKKGPKQDRKTVNTYKTEMSGYNLPEQVKVQNKIDPAKHCLLHNKPHPLSKCRGFREKPIEERKALLKLHRICYKCCRSITHMAKNCDKDIKCVECGSTTHISALHPGPAPWSFKADSPLSEHGGEEVTNTAENAVSSACTKICGQNMSGRSCSKICLVKVYPAGHSEKAVRLYAVLDDQSNRSLVRSEFFDLFDVTGYSFPYSLKTCAGTLETEGRRACNFHIEAIDGSVVLPLPTLIECNEIPHNRLEIPTPEVALSYSHLKHLATQIPELDLQAPIMLLLGRDIIRVHKVRKQVNGPHDAPYAQKLDLGWVIVGDVCLGGVHKPATVNIYYTHTLENGRPSLFEPCPHWYVVKERYCDNQAHVKRVQIDHHSEDFDDVFKTTKNDDKMAPSVEDMQFLDKMDQEVYKDEDNSWVAPLPSRMPQSRLPNNRSQAVELLKSLQRTFRKRPEMKAQFREFMEKIFQSGHAEAAPPLKPGEQCWYLPHFGVYHPKKPSQIRVVFDSSAQHESMSLNQILLAGPDLNNSLLGILLRFRRDAVAFMVDIQQMFHCFMVRPEDRNFLRFLWFLNNDPEQEVVEYRMKVHVFGNSPSPAVAIYCLRRAAQEEEEEFGKDVRQFVERDFYMDDGLRSLPTADMAIDLLKRTQESLACSNLRLHKLASNSKEVMDAFPPEDCASDLKDLDLGAETLPVQRSLGLLWDLNTDCFTFRVQDEERPFTRRGVLSAVNSLYDPLGFVAPVTIQGKAILRDITMDSSDWDAPLPPEKEQMWQAWRNSLQELQCLKIRRAYTHVSPAEANYTELCLFSDASERVVAAVAYLKMISTDGNCHIGFVAGKARLAPRPEQTIPRLELCAAVMAVNMAETINSEMDIKIDATTFYTDSKVVLGYIYNTKRRFYVYVNNRVQRIKRSTIPEQWRYVHTEHDPADIATRPLPTVHLKNSIWFTGPKFLCQPVQPLVKETFTLVDPEQDSEIRAQVTAMSTAVSMHLGAQHFERFSSWRSLTRAVGVLIHIARCFKGTQQDVTLQCKGWHHWSSALAIDVRTQSAAVIIRTVQQEVYAVELEGLRSNFRLPRNSALSGLDPFIDQDGILRVGGRLKQADLGHDEKRPIILPGRHHVSTLVIRHFHEQTRHQGRHFTEGAIRSAGYWIVGGKRCITSLIFQCVPCRKLRGSCQVQKMADLPPDRLSMDPSFTHVGLDVFGPWSVSARRTRGGHALNKRWAVLFTCLSIRAIHIEVVESMDSSSFINALRRFLAIRGPVKHIRSDRGTNFIGACSTMEIPSNAEGETVEKFLSEHGCAWTFNPPHSSHMGGVWERMIGITCRILDSMLQQIGPCKLTHEVLITFMAEVTTIVNNRPLVPVSTDPLDPFILTPATLLTQKVGPCPAPGGDFQDSDLYKQQWRRVQSLADTFWHKWRKQYLCTLQSRKKWQFSQPDLQVGSVVLLKDSQSKRNDWPLGIITDVYPSKDASKDQQTAWTKAVPQTYQRVNLTRFSEGLASNSEYADFRYGQWYPEDTRRGV